ncbi:hypothetical protein QBC98_001808 [Kitasatospora acidiphila]
MWKGRTKNSSRTSSTRAASSGCCSSTTTRSSARVCGPPWRATPACWSWARRSLRARCRTPSRPTDPTAVGNLACRAPGSRWRPVAGRANWPPSGRPGLAPRSSRSPSRARRSANCTPDPAPGSRCSTGRTAWCCASWSTSRHPRSPRCASPRNCRAAASSWCWPARRSASGCATTCTTAWGPRCPDCGCRSTRPAAGCRPRGRWRRRCGPPRWASATRSMSCAGSPTAWRPPTSAGSA